MDATNPTYYQDLPDGYENIDLAGIMSFCAGNAEKYILRSCKTEGMIKGNPVEDLKKALWYIDRERKNTYDLLKDTTVASRVKRTVAHIRCVLSPVADLVYRNHTPDPQLVEVVQSAITGNAGLAIKYLVEAETMKFPTKETLRTLDWARFHVDLELQRTIHDRRN